MYCVFLIYSNAEENSDNVFAVFGQETGRLLLFFAFVLIFGSVSLCLTEDVGRNKNIILGKSKCILNEE